jgi:hypothetical protein
LREEHLRPKCDRTETAAAGLDQLRKALRRSFERDDVGIGQIVGDRFEIALLRRHAAGGNEERAIHFLT